MTVATRVLDPIEVAQKLLRCPSVTPEEGGALTVLEELLTPLGFKCERVTFSEPGTPDVENLYARLGDSGPHLAFAGHTDVVPPGNLDDWTHPPFSGILDGDWLYGRGAVDMKGAIAAFVAAVSLLLQESGGKVNGSISLIVTGDEEGPGVNGTRKVMEWLKERGELPDWCIVGEPTSQHALCDTVKIGRRGSLNATLTVRGKQGHSAYPKQADNPVHRMVAALHSLTSEPLDQGSAHFEPSTLQITSIDVGNTATNVIPARATARFNVRFNDLHDGDSVAKWLRQRIFDAAPNHDLDIKVSGESFLCEPGVLCETLRDAVAGVMRYRPVAGTGGGTSDARFIKDYCEVAELGLRNVMAHQTDERVVKGDLLYLADIYAGAVARLLPDPE